MSWAGIDDKSAFHPKVVAVGNEAWGAQVRMIAYCTERGTDGYVASAIALAICSLETCYRLIEFRMLEEAPGGYQIHDFLDWNLSAKEVESRKLNRKKSGSLGGLAKVANAKQVLKQVLKQNSSKSVAPTPTPTSEEDPPLTSFGVPPSPSAQAATKKPSGKRTKTYMTEDWQPGEGAKAWCRKGNHNGSAHVEQFRDHWLSTGEAKTDWDAAFRNWVRNAPRFAPRIVGSGVRAVDAKSDAVDRAPYMRVLNSPAPSQPTLEFPKGKVM